MKSTPCSAGTFEVNKRALKNYDNERLRSFNGIKTSHMVQTHLKFVLKNCKLNKRLLLILIIKSYKSPY